MNLFNINLKAMERGLVFENGGYSRYLQPGKHRKSFSKDQEIKILDIRQAFQVEGYDLANFKEDLALLEELAIVEVADNEIALRYEDNHFVDLLEEGTYAYWNILHKNDFKIISLENPRIPSHVDPVALKCITECGYATGYNVLSHEQGILLIDNTFIEVLKPGRYSFWANSLDVKVTRVDMRLDQLQLMGQEVMSEDKIPVRINFFCQFKIVDAIIPTLEIIDHNTQLYTLLQLILREYIGTMKFDDILKAKKEIADYTLGKLREKEALYGVEFVYTGVKDIILPGEIKDIMNTVLIAEKRAQANVITRREETASTRSLLNTAKLMDENKTLYKLKELEYLEKICDKVGNISLNSGDGLLSVLNGIVAE